MFVAIRTTNRSHVRGAHLKTVLDKALCGGGHAVPNAALERKLRIHLFRDLCEVGTRTG